MRLALAGLTFEIEGAGQLCASELAFCGEHAIRAGEDPADFTLRIEPDGPQSPDRGRFADGAPAQVEAGGGSRLRVSHRRFLSDLDLTAGRGTLQREPGSGGLAISLRVALCALLPEAGGLPLHAAGVVQAGQGLAFFGVSGAGKSTLAASAPGQVLSDELIVLRSSPWRVLASGFWGEAERPDRPAVAPLVALCELSKAAGFELQPLAPREALRRLLTVVLVPPDAALWTSALSLCARLTREVPVYRLGYALGAPPWAELNARLLAGQPLQVGA